jgi:diguanylate cyclase (GGDEF)-like protein
VVTVSVGVATLAPAESGEELVQRADRALYRAKQAGRDRVEATNPLADSSRQEMEKNYEFKG